MHMHFSSYADSAAAGGVTCTHGIWLLLSGIRSSCDHHTSYLNDETLFHYVVAIYFISCVNMMFTKEIN